MMFVCVRNLSFVTVECAVTIFVESLLNQIELLTALIFFSVNSKLYLCYQ